MKKTKKLIDPRFAKGKMYQGVMKEIAAAKVCPFCPEHFKWHTKPILLRKNGWLITENFNPYKNASHHFLIVGEKHREQFNDIKPKDWAAISYLANWVIKKFSLRGGGLTMRFGDSTYTGATVSHLHLHLLVPEVKNGKAKPVYFPIG